VLSFIRGRTGEKAGKKMDNSLLIASGFAFIQGLAELVYKNKTERHYLSAAIYFLVSVIILHMAGRHTNFFNRYPEFLGWSLPFITWLGPVTYYYLAVSLELDSLGKSRFVTELVPGIIIIAVILISHPSYGGLLYSSTEEMNQSVRSSVPTILFTIFYFGFFMLRFALKLRDFTGSLRLATTTIMPALKGFLFLLFILLIIGSISFIFESFLLLSVTHAMTAVTMFYIYLYHRRYPELMSNWLIHLQQEKYKKSHLKSVNIDKINNDLDWLFSEERLYEDEKLTLERLAERLNLSRHQLSEFFNSHRKTGFTETVNSFRVSAAKRLLTETDFTVLRIGYDVGFASLSAFNRNFRKITGLSPSDYRASNRPNSGKNS